MSEPNLVSYASDGAVAWVVMNRPQARNAIDAALDAELERAWRRFADDDGARVAVLCGEGVDFCAGADLRSYLPQWEAPTAARLRRVVDRGLGGGLTRGLHRLYKPVIAAIHGHAVGAGFELALACDLRVATRDARFGVFEMRAGLHQGDGGLVRLLASCGLARAMELTLTGRTIGADELHALGLLSQLADDVPELRQCAQTLAAKIAALNPHAVRSAKETLIELVGRPLDDALRLEALYGYTSFGDFAEVSRHIRPHQER
jgi:enoyl-CoA hydratase